MRGSPECPALLFDRIKGFPKGLRVFTNGTTSPQRAALALGIDPMLRPLEALKEWMRKRQGLKPHAPVEVSSAPFLANFMRGRNVDLCKLPAPYWHRKDGGPFIGAGEKYELEIVAPDRLLAMLEARELQLRQRFETIIDEFTATRDLLARIDFGEAKSRGAGPADKATEAKAPLQGTVPEDAVESQSPPDQGQISQVTPAEKAAQDRASRLLGCSRRMRRFCPSWWRRLASAA